MIRYLLKADWQEEWTEVSKEVWVRAERAAGFHNTMGRPDEPGTAGFGGGGVRGSIRYEASAQEER